MIKLESINQQNALRLRDVRLRALKDTPDAFGSTYARESQFSEADWIERAKISTGERSAGFLAVETEIPCGIVGAYLNVQDDTLVHLVSMWVAPSHRRLGIGRSLVNAVLEWARNQSAKTLQLMVTSTNELAIKFYQDMGFSMTGQTEPYPNDASLIEFEMSRSI